MKRKPKTNSASHEDSDNKHKDKSARGLTKKLNKPANGSNNPKKSVVGDNAKKIQSEVSGDEMQPKIAKSASEEELKFEKMVRKVLKKIAKELMKSNNLERKVAQNIALNLESRIRNHLEANENIKDMDQKTKNYKISVVDLVKKIQVSCLKVHPLTFSLEPRTRSDQRDDEIRVGY